MCFLWLLKCYWRRAKLSLKRLRVPPSESLRPLWVYSSLFKSKGQSTICLVSSNSPIPHKSESNSVWVSCVCSARKQCYLLDPTAVWKSTALCGRINFKWEGPVLCWFLWSLQATGMETFWCRGCSETEQVGIVPCACCWLMLVVALL